MSDPVFSDLDLSHDEFNRFMHAFKSDEFKKMFKDYCDEIQDPENKKLYEQELTQLEKERGISITFINPEPGFVVKTSVNGTMKAFINVAKSEKVQKPSNHAEVNKNGQRGLNWQIPYTQAPPRRDYDNKKVACTVYDVVFHPDALHLALRDARFRQLLIDTALDGVENNFSVKLDRANLKFPKLKYKGVPKATVIRKKDENFCEESMEPSPLDSIYPKLKEEPVSQPSDKEKTNNHRSVKPEEVKMQPKYATPTYKVVHRRPFEMEQTVDDIYSKIDLTVPTELIYTIDLPLLNSTKDVNLDVTLKKLYLSSEHPAKYKLDIDMPYEVNEKDGSARFDKDARKLVVTLPVIRKGVNIVRKARSEDSGVDSDLESPMIMACEMDAPTFSEESDDKVSLENDSYESNKETFKSNDVEYVKPPFDFSYSNIENHTMVFSFTIKNTEPDSLQVNADTSQVHVQFSSIGDGYFPIFYACLISTGSADIADTETEVTDDNVVLKINLNGPWDGTYSAGLDETSMELFKTVPDQSNYTSSSELSNQSSMEWDCSVKISTLEMHKLSKKAMRKRLMNKNVRSLSESCSTSYNEGSAANSYQRSVSESSDDCTKPPFKGILKRRSSYESECSSLDEKMYSCSLDLGVGSIEDIPEEEDDGQNEISKSCKKSVHFSDIIKKQLFRSNRSILGQRKFVQKRTSKTRMPGRRFSESEAHDFEEKVKINTNSCTSKSHACDKKTAKSTKQDGNNDCKNGMMFDLEM